MTLESCWKELQRLHRLDRYRGLQHTQGALEDCDKSLRFCPRNVLALGTRADAKRLLGDHKVRRGLHELPLLLSLVQYLCWASEPVS